MVARVLIFCACLAGPGCIREAQPDTGLNAVLYGTLYGALGHCVVSAPASAGGGKRLSFCSVLPRANCSAETWLWSASQVTTLRSGVASLSAGLGACLTDGAAEVGFLNSLAAPVSPLLAKFGATIGPSGAQDFSATTVESCESAGFRRYADSAFVQLAEPPVVLRLNDPNIYLARFAGEAACRNAVPLTPAERTATEGARSGQTPELLRCEAAGADDPAIANCLALPALSGAAP